MPLRNKLVLILIVFFNLVAFHNCAPTGSGFGVQVSKEAMIKKYFPEVEGISPLSNVSVSENSLACTGECHLKYYDDATDLGTYGCDGNSMSVGNDYTCGGNLSVTKVPPTTN